MYRLTLTQDEVDSIAWIGDRYAWSSALQDLEPGTNVLAEHEAWRIIDAINEDDAFLPLCDPLSELYEKITDFALSVV